MLTVDVFPKYMYKDNDKYERTVVNIPVEEIWEVNYFNKRTPEDYMLFKWDGIEERANAILRLLGEHGFRKTKKL